MHDHSGGSKPYAVIADSRRVTAWSGERLPFEPTGWKLAFRGELRAALSQLSPGPGDSLIAVYEARDPAGADLENVLLYNVGSAYWRRLLVGGLLCWRRVSDAPGHRMTYALSAGLPPLPTIYSGLLGSVELNLSAWPAQSAGIWWTQFRPSVRRIADHTYNGPFAVAAEIKAPKPVGPALADHVKYLIDGLVSAFHAHDGSQAQVLRPRLAALGDPGQVWERLVSREAAVLGVRPLLHPRGENLQWNPADDRCAAIRLTSDPAPRITIRAELRAQRS